jgi:hypothetical protein
MYTNCRDCIIYSKSLKEKENSLIIYETNLIEIKQKIFDSNELISSFLILKQENENMKKEIENAKSNSDSVKNTQINYEVK